MSIKKSHWFIAIILLVTIGSVWAFSHYEDAIFDTMDAKLRLMQELYAEHPVWVILAYSLAYTLLLVVLVPADMVMMLLAGMLFGIFWGSLIACTAHTLGATINFIMSKFVFKRIESDKSKPAIKTGKSTWFYLLLLRMTPLVPAHTISLMMGGTSLSVASFFAGTWVGSLPMSILFAFLGRHLHYLENPSLLLTPEVIGGCVIALILLFLAKYYGDRFIAKREAQQANALAATND